MLSLEWPIKLSLHCAIERAAMAQQTDMIVVVVVVVVVSIYFVVSWRGMLLTYARAIGD